MLPFSMAFLTLSFSAFSSLPHLWLCRTSCLLVNLRLKIWSSSLSPPMPMGICLEDKGHRLYAEPCTLASKPLSQV